jgi:DNA-binding beta-propeller fold protein YncE
MKKWIVALFLALGAASLGLGTTALAQQPVPEIPFDADINFLKLPADMNLGEASGVAVNSKGQIAVFTRSNSAGGPAYAATASQLLLFDQGGKFIREIGKGLYAWSYAHATRFDKDDNLWAIDKGSDMIVRFNPEGKVTMVFGRKKEASDEAEPWTRVNPPRPPVNGQFRQPTDVAWDTQGNIYISDGYINSRVAKFTKDGDWVASIGEPGREKGQLNTPHSIANDAKGNIYVADRGNRRIQVIDPATNKFVREIHIDVPVPPNTHPWMGADPTPEQATAQSGAPWAICITPPNAGGTQYLYAADAFPGRVYKLTLDGKVLGWLGKVGHQPKQFGWIHEIACPSENTLFVGELLNWRVQKLTLRPTAQTSTAGR